MKRRRNLQLLNQFQEWRFINDNKIQEPFTNLKNFNQTDENYSIGKKVDILISKIERRRHFSSRFFANKIAL